MARATASMLAGAALALAGAAAGFAVARWSTAEPPRAERFERGGGTPALDLTPLHAELARTRDELRAAIEALARAPAPAGSPVRSATDPQLAQLVERVEALALALETRGDFGRGTGYAGLEDLVEQVAIEVFKVRRALSAGTELRSNLRERHRGWSRQAFFARYGPPESESVDGEVVSLRYVLDAPQGISLAFKLASDRFVDVEWQ